MKIITDGREKTFIKQCDVCRTDFEYSLKDVECKEEEDDIYVEPEANMALDLMKGMGMVPKKSNVFVKCPVCKSLIEADFYEKGAMSVPSYGMVGMGR